MCGCIPIAMTSRFFIISGLKLDFLFVFSALFFSTDALFCRMLPLFFPLCYLLLLPSFFSFEC